MCDRLPNVGVTDEIAQQRKSEAVVECAPMEFFIARCACGHRSWLGGQRFQGCAGANEFIFGSNSWPTSEFAARIGFSVLGMSAEDAKKLLPGLQLSAVTVNSALDSAVSPAAGRASYRYGACAFRLTLNFHRDRLDAANLDLRGSANLDCKRFIARRLNQQFGMVGGHLIPITPDAVFSPPSGQSGGNTTTTHMVYFFRGDGIRFHP